MSVSLQQLDRAEAPDISVTLRNAGVAGAGGAGFPSHAKWARLDEVDSLLVNHQESEPNYYIDKWLGREHADEYAALFDALLEEALDSVVISAKEKDRDRWLADLEAATDGTVFGPEDLPLDADDKEGVVFAYTEDEYQYGMESVLLRLVDDTVLGDDLPMDYGWIVQNTETLFDIYRALDGGKPVTRKLVHVAGVVPDHRFLDVPVGTPASRLLEAAGRDPDDLADDELLMDGGPGWCFEIDKPPDEFGVRKRTNCLLVVDEKTAWEHTYGGDRINLLEPYDWAGDHEEEPTSLEPERVNLPLITNPAFEGVVSPARPVVEPGVTVDRAEMVATPDDDDISNAHHAPIPGTVTEVADRHVVIESGAADGASSAATETIERTVYWTWCSDCGDYLSMPDAAVRVGSTEYVCQDCW